MHKSTITALAVVAALVMTLGCSRKVPKSESKDKNQTLSSQLQGHWKLVSKTDESGKTLQAPDENGDIEVVLIEGETNKQLEGYIQGDLNVLVIKNNSETPMRYKTHLNPVNPDEKSTITLVEAAPLGDSEPITEVLEVESLKGDTLKLKNGSTYQRISVEEFNTLKSQVEDMWARLAAERQIQAEEEAAEKAKKALEEAEKSGAPMLKPAKPTAKVPSYPLPELQKPVSP